MRFDRELVMSGNFAQTELRRHLGPERGMFRVKPVLEPCQDHTCDIAWEAQPHIPKVSVLQSRVAPGLGVLLPPQLESLNEIVDCIDVRVDAREVFSAHGRELT
jgi:hypothetical protein